MFELVHIIMMNLLTECTTMKILSVANEAMVFVS